MTVFSRLLTPAPSPDKSVQEKIAALDAQTVDFARIALGDGEEALRAAAAGKLEYGDALVKLAGLGSAPASPAVERAARQRIAHLLDTGAADYAQFQRQTADQATLLSILALCAKQNLVQEAIAQINDGDLLCSLAVGAPSSKVRQLAAESIQEPALLRRVLKQIRGSDKNVYKIVKAKCDALLAQEKAAADTQAHIESLCVALEKHSHLPFDNLFTPTLDYLHSQWRTVAAQATPDALARAEQAINRCRDTVTKHLQLVASQAAHDSAVASADANREIVLADLRHLLAAAYEGGATDSQLSSLDDRWSALADYKPPNQTDRERFGALRDALVDLRQLVGQHGSVAEQGERFSESSTEPSPEHERALRKTLAFLPLLGDSVPAAAAKAAAALRARTQTRADEQAESAAAIRQLSGLVHKGLAALRDGQSRQAAGIRRSIEDKLQTKPSLPEHLTKQLQQLDSKLGELQDWKSYVVAPKRIELIEQMEALIGSTDSPAALAEKIKKLQDEWKTISKGAADSADAEWQRFHQAAQTAYAPCREYFAAQSKQRQSNLEKRQALLTRLIDFEKLHNWEQPDWREVAKALRESRQQWRNYQPVERAPNKPLQASFDALTAKLQALLDAEYGRNLEERKTLVARAAHLLTQEDTRKAIDEAKRLQLAWKNAGIVAREDDQKLWAEFRLHCDAVFGKRDQQHSEHVAGLEANKSKAIALCEEAEQLLKLSGQQLIEAAKNVSPLRQTFDAVGELPKAVARDLQQRFDRAVERVEKSVARQRALDKAQAWDSLLAAADLIRLHRLAVLENLPADECEACKQSTQAFVDGVQHWPKNGMQAVKAELGKDGGSDLAANEAALRTLCIRCEILTDTPTPSSDQAFRRNYQLQRLMQSMGQGLGKAQSSRDELDAMVFEWLAIGPTSSAVYSELLRRFKECRAKALG